MIRRGEIWVASFRPWRGQEVGKVRPGVIMQADWLNDEQSGTVIVLPLTSQLRANTEQLRFPVAARGRLKKPSWVLIDKIQAIDSQRLSEGPLASLTAEEMAAIEQHLRAVLGMI